MKRLSLLELSAAIKNVVFLKDDMSALEALAEIGLLCLVGEDGAHPSLETMMQVMRVKDERTARRVMKKLEGRWSRQEVTGKGIVRRPKPELELEITAVTRLIKDGELKLTGRRQFRVPLAQAIGNSYETSKPPTSHDPSHSMPSHEMPGVASDAPRPPTFHAPVPPASDAPLTVVQKRTEVSEEQCSTGQRLSASPVAEVDTDLDDDPILLGPEDVVVEARHIAAILSASGMTVDQYVWSVDEVIRKVAADRSGEFLELLRSRDIAATILSEGARYFEEREAARVRTA